MKVKRFKVGERVVAHTNSTTRGTYLGRFRGLVVVKLDRPILTRQYDLIGTRMFHPSYVFLRKEN